MKRNNPNTSLHINSTAYNEGLWRKRKIFSSLDFWGFDTVVRISNNEGNVWCCQKFKNLLIFLYWKNQLFCMEEWGSLYFFVNQESLFTFSLSPATSFEVLPASLLLFFTQNSIKSNIQRQEAAKDKLLKIKPATGECSFKVSAKLWSLLFSSDARLWEKQYEQTCLEINLSQSYCIQRCFYVSFMLKKVILLESLCLWE